MRRVFFLRANTTEALIEDAHELTGRPQELGILRNVGSDSVQPGANVSVVQAGAWQETPPVTDEENNETAKAVMGDHALVNVIAFEGKDDDLIELMESLEPADSSLHPDDVDPSKKLPNGTHRTTKPSGQVRKFA